jgi:hypothetical protein
MGPNTNYPMKQHDLFCLYGSKSVPDIWLPITLIAKTILSLVIPSEVSVFGTELRNLLPETGNHDRTGEIPRLAPGKLRLSLGMTRLVV